MPDEDQERFEDYLELEHYIEQLQAERVAHPPTELTPGQANIYRMAALFRSASPEASEPRPEFAAELQARLEQEIQQRQQQVELSTAQRKKERKPLRYVSRRALLAGGAAVAASLVVGAGIERAVEQAQQGSSQSTASNSYAEPIIAAGVPTTWHFVAALSDLGDKAIRFVADTVLGYVIRDDGDDGAQNKGKIIAMSAACTHMGCIVQWQDADRKFHCPCHGGLFTEYGHADAAAAPIRYLSPLPRFNTKVVAGKVYVEVPLSPCTARSQAEQ